MRLACAPQEAGVQPACGGGAPPTRAAFLPPPALVLFLCSALLAAHGATIHPPKAHFGTWCREGHYTSKLVGHHQHNAKSLSS